MKLSFFSKLQQLLNQSYSDRTIACTFDEEISESNFIAAVRQLVTALEQSPAGSAILYADCAYKFLVGLAACSLSERNVILASDLKRSTLDHLKDYASFVLTDSLAPTGIALPVVDIAVVADGSVDRPLPKKPIQISLCTSGSTGTFTIVSKTFEQLEAEVGAHETLWDEVAPETWIAGSVSQQHIYGLLFRVLWPFLTERCIFAPQLVFPEDLQKLLDRKTEFAFISSPALLKRLPGLMSLSGFKPYCKAIFSSGGPLDLHTALKFSNAIVEPIELYGSTETGGIAWRKGSDTSSTWTTLPEVSVRSASPAHTIEIDSPFIDADSWYQGADVIASVTDSSFKLIGRSDKIVKIEEKRVSLTQVEGMLQSLEYVDDCVVFPRVVSPGRTLLAAVVGLSSLGVKYLRAHGRKQLLTKVKEELKKDLESGAIPRSWKLLEQLPRNSQGKLVQEDLENLFFERLDLPLVSDVTHSNDALELRCKVPEDLCYLEGHFPEHPIVPGFVQFDWALYFAREHLALPDTISQCNALKFNVLMQPGDDCTLQLSYQEDRRRLSFEFSSESSKYSSGKVTF